MVEREVQKPRMKSNPTSSRHLDSACGGRRLKPADLVLLLLLLLLAE
jgi:hypothetical protein